MINTNYNDLNEFEKTWWVFERPIPHVQPPAGWITWSNGRRIITDLIRHLAINLPELTLVDTGEGKSVMVMKSWWFTSSPGQSIPPARSVLVVDLMMATILECIDPHEMINALVSHTQDKSLSKTLHELLIKKESEMPHENKFYRRFARRAGLACAIMDAEVCLN